MSETLNEYWTGFEAGKKHAAKNMRERAAKHLEDHAAIVRNDPKRHQTIRNAIADLWVEEAILIRALPIDAEVQTKEAGQPEG